MTTPAGFSIQIPGHGRMLSLHQADAVDKAAKHHASVTALFSIPQILAAIEAASQVDQYRADVATEVVRGLGLEELS